MPRRKIIIGVFEAILVLGLIRGLLLLADPGVPRWAVCIGIAVNLLMQWVAITSLRKLRLLEQAPPAEQLGARNRQQEVLRALFIACPLMFLAFLTDVGLLITHKISTQSFAVVVLATAAFMFVILMICFTRLQKARG